MILYFCDFFIVCLYYIFCISYNVQGGIGMDGGTRELIRPTAILGVQRTTESKTGERRFHSF